MTMSITVGRTTRGLICAGLVALVAAGFPSRAAAGPQVSAARVQSLRSMGGASRFVAPVRTVDALKRSMARPAIQKDLTTVLNQAGLGSIEAQVRRILAEGQVTESALATGTSMEWMARRRGRRPDVLRSVRWDGRTPLDGYEFIVDDMNRTYTFFVPSICGNLSLVRQEPSREAARVEAARVEAARVAEAARVEAARVAEAARVEAARVEAARVEAARVEAARVEAARVEAARVEAARVEAARVEAARVEAARVEADRLAAAQQEARDLRVRPFLAGAFGKQHGLASAVSGCGGCLVAGMTAGTALKLNERWTFAPALGVFSKVEGGRRASLLADASFNYMLTGGGYVGTGLTFWDITHGDNRTLGWLAGAGLPVWKNDVRKHQLQTVIEWRQMFNEAKERSDARRMVWVGLRYLFK